VAVQATEQSLMNHTEYERTNDVKLGPSHLRDVLDPEIRQVPIRLLYEADSPRLCGESPEHTRVLLESQAELPPIIVHRQTMRVIDGMHRLRAACLAGRDTIDVRFFDGSVEDSFVQAVMANNKHGLPLSLADRKAAATRIVTSHPHWSDRTIARVAGLAPKTVGAIRKRDGSGAATVTRIGRDGRARPLNTAERRRLAGEIIARQPEASLRTVAMQAGISPTTVRDVRDKIRAGERRQRSDGSLQAPPSQEEPPSQEDR
jgi:ParB-like chromosome segregation protein Spo0J